MLYFDANAATPEQLERYCKILAKHAQHDGKIALTASPYSTKLTGELHEAAPASTRQHVGLRIANGDEKGTHPSINLTLAIGQRKY
jgi:hypothetical protein